MLDFHDLSRETLLVIASPDLLLLLPMALIERETDRERSAVRQRLWRTDGPGPTLILEIATDRQTHDVGRAGKKLN